MSPVPPFLYVNQSPPIPTVGNDHRRIDFLFSGTKMRGVEKYLEGGDDADVDAFS